MATAAKRKTATAKRAPVANGRPAGVKTRTTRKTTKARARSNGVAKTRTRYVKANPGMTSKLLVALGAAFVIRTFDGVVMRFIPALSAPVMVFGKLAAGWAVGRYTRRWLGSWAEILEYGLYISGALTAWDAWVAPVVNPLLGVGGTPQVTNVEQIQATDGQIGRRLYLNDGNVLDVFPDQTQASYAM